MHVCRGVPGATTRGAKRPDKPVFKRMGVNNGIFNQNNLSMSYIVLKS